MSFFCRKIFLFIFFSFISSFFLFTKVAAFSVFPLRQTFIVDPGKSFETFIDVKNDGKSDQEFVFGVDAFSLDEKTGKIQFGKRDMSLGWFTMSPTSTVLAAGKSKRILFTVHVPDDAKAALYPLALTATQKSVGGQVGISGRIASLLFLHVAGKVEEKGVLENFSFQKSISFFTPIQFDFALQNRGNTYFIPEGAVTVQSFWGETVAGTFLNTEKQKILGGENFIRTASIDEIPWYAAGKMKATLSLKYGLGGQVLSEEKTFWYFSWKMLFLLGSFLFITLSVWTFKKKARF